MTARPAAGLGRSLVAVGAALLTAGCTSPAGTPGTSFGRSSASSIGSPSIASPSIGSPSIGSPSIGSPSIDGSGAPSAAARALAAMSERARVGQLLMVDCPTTGITAATRAALREDQVGAVILDGTSQAGLAAMRDVTDGLRADARRGVGLLIATDQEGGLVQRLQGPGFDTIPTAVAQGELTPAALQRAARRWGAQLRSAGVDLDLAPVLDTVPADRGANPPIGDLDREYGHTPAAVAAHGVAYARGMAAAGVDVTAKHFPGLGRVVDNTDVTVGVTDSVTTRDDPYLTPFRDAIRAGVPFVMMSTAIYARLDPGVPAAFAKPIVTGLLRERLGFRGVVISDDVGAAQQVAAYSPGQRAVDFVAAGGDMVLTVNASLAGPMTAALLAKARSSRAFKRLVDAAALRVLQAKQARGLV